MASGARSRTSPDASRIAGRACRVRIRMDEDQRAVARHRGRPLQSRAARHFHGRAAGRRHAPEVPPVDIVLVRGVNHLAAVRRHRHMLHFESARSKQRRVAARNGHGIQMRPAVALPGKHQPVAGPEQIAAPIPAGGTRCRRPRRPSRLPCRLFRRWHPPRGWTTAARYARRRNTCARPAWACARRPPAGCRATTRAASSRSTLGSR